MDLTLEELYQIIGELEVTRRKQAQMIAKLNLELEDKQKPKIGEDDSPLLSAVRRVGN